MKVTKKKQKELMKNVMITNISNGNMELDITDLIDQLHIARPDLTREEIKLMMLSKLKEVGLEVN